MASSYPMTWDKPENLLEILRTDGKITLPSGVTYILSWKKENPPEGYKGEVFLEEKNVRQFVVKPILEVKNPE